MKQCPFCKKELPDELEFCPYCMQKLNQVQEIFPESVKPKSSKSFFMKAIASILVLVFTAVAIWLFVDTYRKSISSDTSTSSTVSDQADYSDYVGVWQSKEITSQNVEQQLEGGTTLEIITVKDSVIRFNLTKTSAYPNQRIAQLNNVTAEIIDNVVSFSFSDDGWGNSGTGKLKLSKDEIYAEVTILEENSSAQWNIAMTSYLSRREDTIQDMDMNYLLEDFNQIRDIFGEETASPQENMYDSSISHYFEELTINVNPYNNRIMSFSVNYDPAGNKERYHFKGINGNSTLEDVIKIMGQPVLNTVNQNGEIGYSIKNGFIKFYIDANMNVTGFLAFLSET